MILMAQMLLNQTSLYGQEAVNEVSWGHYQNIFAICAGPPPIFLKIYMPKNGKIYIFPEDGQ